MKIISANQNRILNIGKVGENLVSAVEFDLTEFFQAYTSGTPALIVRQAGTDTLYLADLAVNEEKAVWVIQRSDVSRAGTGACQSPTSAESSALTKAVFCDTLPLEEPCGGTFWTLCAGSVVKSASYPTYCGFFFCIYMVSVNSVFLEAAVLQRRYSRSFPYLEHQRFFVFVRCGIRTGGPQSN